MIAKICSLSTPLNNAISSERSRPSAAAIELVPSLSAGLGPAFEQSGLDDQVHENEINFDVRKTLTIALDLDVFEEAIRSMLRSFESCT
ncbi:hypothetical protein AZE42_12621 [Rhizopogon vesiculosus]|uniref:Uncharacterized protein n=1 Tax=Rhizopogon vesiculosus TaxID=180088 RepID=A0A1J8PWJ1_9AGAM|nr:hypothetical protein AZE42_12621 [Rhizopogon vesiculosus]